MLGSHDRNHLRRVRARLPIRVSLRLWAALTALVFVVSSLFGLIHEATTKHVRCAEHGELMHGDPALAVRTATAAPVHDSVVREVAVTTLHGHEHCALTRATRDSRVELRGPAVVPAPLAISEIAGAAPRVVAQSGDSLYRTAPKTSPPA